MAIAFTFLVACIYKSLALTNYIVLHDTRAGLVHTWSILMGVCAGSVPWVTMMFLQQKLDDTHAVAGLGDVLTTGLLGTPNLMALQASTPTFYGGALFVLSWNVVVTTGILLRVGLFVPLRMPDDQLRIGDDAAHGEEPYVLWPLGRWPEFRRDTQ